MVSFVLWLPVPWGGGFVLSRWLFSSNTNRYLDLFSWYCSKMNNSTGFIYSVLTQGSSVYAPDQTTCTEPQFMSIFSLALCKLWIGWQKKLTLAWSWCHFAWDHHPRHIFFRVRAVNFGSGPSVTFLKGPRRSRYWYNWADVLTCCSFRFTILSCKAGKVITSMRVLVDCQ